MRCPSLLTVRRRGRFEWLVAVLLVVLVIAAMVPLIGTTRRTAQILRCRQQLLRIYTAVQNYALNYNGYPPCQPLALAEGGSGNWRQQVEPLLAEGGEAPRRLWQCPAGGPYVGNVHLFGPPYRPLSDYLLKKEVGVIADGRERCEPLGLGDSAGIDWRHRGGANVILLDGHVEYVPQDKAVWTRRHWDHPQ